MTKLFYQNEPPTPRRTWHWGVLTACAAVALAFLPTCGREEVPPSGRPPLTPVPSRTVPPPACGKVTFEDVKPLISKNCATCHPGFLSYNTAKAKAPEMLTRMKLPKGAKSMPKDADPLSPNQIGLVEQWVVDGFPQAADCQQRPTPSTPARVLTGDEMNALIVQDLTRLNSQDRLTTRYLSAGHLAANLPQALFMAGKAVNSVSHDARIKRPVKVDAEGQLLRVNLRDYQLSAAQWELLVGKANENKAAAENVFYVTDDGASIRNQTKTDFPLVKADWFTVNVLAPDVYHNFAKIPSTAAQLEAQLGINEKDEFLALRPTLTGFRRSGVALNNRLVTCHHIADGAYCKSFDFRSPEQAATNNLFAFPLDVNFGGDAAFDFTHGGGETIFSLPNGLHGYQVVNDVGVRQNAVPTDIAVDRIRTDKIEVTNSISCFACHNQGMIDLPADEIKDAVLRSSGFPKNTSDRVRLLYREPAYVAAELAEYNEAYADAVKLLGGDVNGVEPISEARRSYDLDGLDAARMAGETGITVDELTSCILGSPALSSTFNAILSNGRVERKTFIEGFPVLKVDCQLGQNRLVPSPTEQP